MANDHVSEPFRSLLAAVEPKPADSAGETPTRHADAIRHAASCGMEALKAMAILKAARLDEVERELAMATSYAQSFANQLADEGKAHRNTVELYAQSSATAKPAVDRNAVLEEAARVCEEYRDELDKSGQEHDGHAAHRAAKRIRALKDKP